PVVRAGSARPSGSTETMSERTMLPSGKSVCRDVVSSNEFVFYKIFRDLNGVGCCAFTEIVGNNPHVERVRVAFIATDPSYENIVFALSKQRHRIFTIVWIVEDCNTRSFLKESAHIVNVEVAFKL